MNLAIVLCLVSAASVFAQEFEAASIKPSGPKSIRGSEGGPGTKDPDRFSFGRADLLILVMIAYDVEDLQQVSSKTALDRDEFDLVATLPPGSTKGQFHEMLKNLLKERFHLKAHVESKEFPAYALEVAKGGAKLKPASPQSEPAPRQWLQSGFPDLPPDRPGLIANNSMTSGGGMLVRIKGQQQPMTPLAGMLRAAADQMVVDRTGLSGNFDFTLEFSKGISASSERGGLDAPGAPTLNTALQQQLGLQLINQRLPLDLVIVDSVDRSPSAN